MTDRQIAPQEAAIVRWMLENAAVLDISNCRMSQVENLEVVGGCECGCASIDFRTTGVGESKILADAMAIYPDAQEAGLILWGCEGEIAGLEFYELDPVADRIPQLDYLRRFNLGVS